MLMFLNQINKKIIFLVFSFHRIGISTGFVGELILKVK